MRESPSAVIALVAALLVAPRLSADAHALRREGDGRQAAVTAVEGRPQVVALEGGFEAGTPNAALRHGLALAATRVQRQPFIALVARSLPTGPHDTGGAGAGASATPDVDAMVLVTPTLVSGGAMRLKLGPWVVRPERTAPAAWWESHVDFTDAEIREAARKIESEPETNTAPPSVRTRVDGIEGHPSVGKQLPLGTMGSLHDAAVSRFVRHSPLNGAAPDATGDSIDESARPKLLSPQPPFIPHLGQTSALELVVWIESVDAAQCELRASGRVKQADEAIVDLKALLRSLRTPGLLRRLEERVPLQAGWGSSLCASASWPADAWELVDAVAQQRVRLERIRGELMRLAAAVAGEYRLAPEILARLEERLERVAELLPTNLEWNQRIASEIHDHLGELMDPAGAALLQRTNGARNGNLPNASNSGGLAASAMTGRDDIVGGYLAANRACWDVYGFLWSGKDALLPSEASIVAAQRSAVLAKFAQVAAEMGMPPDTSRLLSVELATTASDPWRPWVQFPLPDEAFQSTISRIESDLRFAIDPLRLNEFRRDGEWNVSSWWGVLDCGFACAPNVEFRQQRNQPFPDCRPYFMNAVGLGSMRR